MSAPQLHIPLDRLGRVGGDLTVLYALQAAIRRNTPADCERSLAENTRDVIDQSRAQLRGVHVYAATLQDGTELYFTGQALPPYVTLPAALRAAGYRGEVIQ